MLQLYNYIIFTIPMQTYSNYSKEIVSYSWFFIFQLVMAEGPKTDGFSYERQNS
jgi:hypothetical protein